MQASSAILCGLHDGHCVPRYRKSTFIKTPEEESQGEENEDMEGSQEIAPIHICSDNGHTCT